MLENRPWGTYEILHEDINYKVKKIVVNPNQRLSYQFHKNRDENWIIVDGVALITIDDVDTTRHPGESIFIPRLTKHRVTPLQGSQSLSVGLTFIEVQTGESFDEDDIVRIDDDYGRS